MRCLLERLLALHFSAILYCWSNNLAGGGSLSNTLNGFQCWSRYLILLYGKFLQKRVNRVMLANLFFPNFPSNSKISYFFSFEQIIFEGVYALHPSIRKSLDFWIAVVRMTSYSIFEALISMYS
jgi:hypothetical protein